MYVQLWYIRDMSEKEIIQKEIAERSRKLFEEHKLVNPPSSPAEEGELAAVCDTLARFQLEIQSERE